MLAGNGELAGVRLLSRESVDLMRKNHLPEALIPLDKTPRDRYEGLGFGLGVAVRVQNTSFVPEAEIGEYGWIGGASTEFWISPRDGLAVITLAQLIPFSGLSRAVKPITYGALDERSDSSQTDGPATGGLAPGSTEVAAS